MGHRISNNRGAALILAYIVMAALVTLSAGFALSTFNELNDARRYRDSLAAFWLAESALASFLQNTSMLDKSGAMNMTYPQGSVVLQKDDSYPTKRLVTATGNVGGTKRSLQLEFPALAPEVFNNTVSVKGDILISGKKSNLAFNDKTRISGQVAKSSQFSTVNFEDLKEKTDSHLVSMLYPDANNNGVVDEFEDFVQVNRNLVTTYPKEEVIYVKGNDTYTVVPSSALKGKKIIFVEGSRSGKGNVIIQYMDGWQDDENLTIIATGNVTFNQLGMGQTNSQLNVIAWGGYSETAALPGTRRGMIYTHGIASFDAIDETSITYGSVVANEGLKIKEIWSYKSFYYADTRINGVVPPGFEGLIGGRLSSGYAVKPNAWREI